MQFFSKKSMFFGSRHLGEKSGSGPRESESTRHFEESEGNSGISRVL